MKFNLGDRVAQIRIGNPFVGTIIGICNSSLYIRRDLVPMGKARVNQDKQLEFCGEFPWFKFYENWLEEPIYYVKLDEPQPNCSFMEFCKTFDVPPDDVSEKVYLRTSFKTDLVAHPEFDLALLD